jgi:glutathione S-transferase
MNDENETGAICTYLAATFPQAGLARVSIRAPRSSVMSTS